MALPGPAQGWQRGREPTSFLQDLSPPPGATRTLTPASCMKVAGSPAESGTWGHCLGAQAGEWSPGASESPQTPCPTHLRPPAASCRLMPPEQFLKLRIFRGSVA